MPIDRMFADPMLGTFRTMAAEIRDKRLTGAAVDAMNAELARMERYAAEMSDFNAFSARLMQEGCFQKFSEHYGQALADGARAAAQAPAAAGADPDAGLLAQTLAAYEDAARRYPAEVAAGRMKARDAAPLLRAVNAILELGRSGVTYPVFLRLLVERGLDRALEGTAVVRDALAADVAWAEELQHPVELALRRAVLAAFDELAARAPFGVPDALELELRRQRLEWEYAPALARWKAVHRRWAQLFDLVHDWLDAFTAFAPHDARWASTSAAETQRNLRRTQQVTPFRVAQHERILRETCGLGWDDVFRHETYAVAWHTVDLALSADKVQQLVAARPLCVPGGRPTPALIAAAEDLRARRADLRHAELEARAQRMRARYDALHGAGAYARDFAS